MKTLTLFNHKGGVGKTTITINLSDALVDLGFRVLMIDADPQCNLTSFFLEEDYLDRLLGESDDIDTSDEMSSDGTIDGTIWSAIKPVVAGKGSIRVLHRFEYSDLSASSEEACRHRLRAGGLEKVNRVRRQGLQSGTPTGA